MKLGFFFGLKRFGLATRNTKNEQLAFPKRLAILLNFGNLGNYFHKG